MSRHIQMLYLLKIGLCLSNQFVQLATAPSILSTSSLMCSNNL